MRDDRWLWPRACGQAACVARVGGHQAAVQAADVQGVSAVGARSEWETGRLGAGADRSTVSSCRKWAFCARWAVDTMWWGCERPLRPQVVVSCAVSLYHTVRIARRVHVRTQSTDAWRPVHDVDAYVLVTELVDGEELLEHLLQQGVFSESGAKALVTKIATTLQYLHAHRVVHGDLKPENILVRSIRI